jgi:hypothetical protein
MDYVTLTFGLCAVFLSYHGQTAAGIGQIKDGMCDPRLAMSPTNGERISLNGHAVGVDALENGYAVYVDGQRFLLRESKGI